MKSRKNVSHLASPSKPRNKLALKTILMEKKKRKTRETSKNNKNKKRSPLPKATILLPLSAESWFVFILFRGFPVKTGRVALTRQMQWAETACATVKFPPFSFYPDKEVHVQITTNHWNISINNYIHDATVSWVQLANYEGFQVSKRLNSFNTFIYLLH